MGRASNSYDVCIIGAGPASLACVSAIQEPYLVDLLTEYQAQRAAQLHHRHHQKLSICVVDPNQQWLASWKSNFKQLCIKHLRSPALAHPNMFDSNSLLMYACKHGRDQDELYKSNCSDAKQLYGLGTQTNVGLWDLPSTSLFTDFCDEQTQNLSHTYLQGYASDLKAGDNGNYRLDWADISGMKHTLSARQVILAMGMVGKPVIPRGLVTCPAVSWKSSNAFSFSSPKTPRNILVVGGGLTAVQTALRVVKDGHMCVLCSRRPLQEKHFDIPIEWFDHRTANHCLSKFYHETIENRLHQLKEARDGGSIPPMYMQHLEKKKQRLTCWVGEVVHDDRASSRTNGKIGIQFKDMTYFFDRVILATGVQPDCTACPFCNKVLESFPISVHGGFPNVTHDLRWSEGSNIFVAGAMAALTVGPDSGNLMGMRRAAMHIAGTLERRRWLRKTILANSYDALMISSESESESDEECSDDECSLCDKD